MPVTTTIAHKNMCCIIPYHTTQHQCDAERSNRHPPHPPTRVNLAKTTQTQNPGPELWHNYRTQVTTIDSLLNKQYEDTKPSQFIFEFTEEAAAHNSNILARNEFDLEQTLGKLAPGTHLEYGSEFRPTSDLEPLLCNHELWPRTKQLLEKGAEIPLKEMPEGVEKADLDKGLVRGNHKGAKIQQKLLRQLISKDIEHAFALPITKQTASSIKRGWFAPLNIQTQWTINEQGERVKKRRLTHDQSFKGLESGVSLNEQVLSEELEPLIYGFMFLRICHMIHTMRLKHPFTAILICKIDLDAAFRRMHLNAASAVKCICVTTVCAAIYLRLTFGGAFSPAEWCVMIEVITDLALDIANNPLWSPTRQSAPKPTREEIPDPALQPPQVPFEQALPVDTDVNTPRHGHYDSYVDDIVGICVDLGDNARRTLNAILLTLHLLAKPFYNKTNDQPSHEYILSMKKWRAEGKQEEHKIVLGWEIDTRAFVVKLPEDKHIAYTNQINQVLQAGKIEHKNLENMIGRLQRASYVAPHSKYFLNRLRTLCKTTEKTTWANIPQATRDDLELWKEFLKKGRGGTSINNIVFRSPSTYHWADSCPFGLGGYSASGRAWRFYIPANLRSQHTNNVLEYIAIIVTIWIEALENRLPPLSCCLAMSDSTSTVGWLHKTNFNRENRPVHEDCSRHIARIMMAHNSTIYSQHQRGKSNVIADVLSRWHFLTDIELTTYLRCSFPSQIPTNFQISEVPSEVSSWITSSLRKLQTTTQSRSKPTRTNIERGDDGSPGWKLWAAGQTPSLLGLRELRKPEWSELLRCLSVEGNTVIQDTGNHWSQARSARPCQTWLRPFRSTINKTHGKTKTTNKTSS